MSLGIDRTEWSPTLQRKIVRAGTKNRSFAAGSEDLHDYLHLKVDVKQVERLTEAIGAVRCAQRDADVECYLRKTLTERKGKPEGVEAPAVAVVGVDGGRLQIRSSAPACAPAARAADADDALPADDKHRGTHWREDKIGLLMTMASEVKASDPCPEVPAVFVDPTRIVTLARELKTKKAATVPPGGGEVAVPADASEPSAAVRAEEERSATWTPPEVLEKYLTATRRPWPAFGPMVAARAWQLGFFAAERQGFVGDGSDNVWTLWRRHFSSFVPILDIIHSISYLFAAATAGRPFAEGWACYVRWMAWTWQGDVEKVIAELAQRQAEQGCPEASDGDTHPRVVVATALGYLQNHKDKMRYPEYRRQGLPITSSYVESAVKQFNQRLKGTEKFWREEGAETLLQMRADDLSPASVLNEFWQDRQEAATGQQGQNAYAQAP